MESFFFDIGFGWVWSKIMPFICMLLLGVLLYILSRRAFKKRWQRITSLLFIVLPMFLYFIVSPIYEGDFSDTYKELSKTEQMFELEPNRLTVLAIPGCQFCEATISQLKQLKERLGSKIEIDFIVCTPSLDGLDHYKKLSNGKINVRIVKNMNAMVKLAGSKFPAFVYSEGKDKVRVWNNNEFGLYAKDWIESKY